MKRSMSLAVMTSCILFLGVHRIEAQENRVAVKVQDNRVEFHVQGQKVAEYRIKGYSQPILWPVLSQSGHAMTRPWPMDKNASNSSKDHPHHQSVWFCHGDVIPKGIELKQKVRGVEGVDFWSVNKGHGEIVCTDVKTEPDGKLSGAVTTKNEWRTADGQKILDETRKIILYDFGKARLFVFEIDLHASVCPITFGDTKEGSMALRVNDAISELRGKGTIQNAEGQKTEKECWGQHSAWCDYSGTIDGNTVGIAIFDDNANPTRASWHARGYGLMAANPFGRKRSQFPAVKGQEDLVGLAKGQHLQLRYGVLVHEGDATSGNVAGYYQRFIRIRELNLR